MKKKKKKNNNNNNKPQNKKIRANEKERGRRKKETKENHLSKRTSPSREMEAQKYFRENNGSSKMKLKEANTNIERKKTKNKNKKNSHRTMPAPTQTTAPTCCCSPRLSLADVKITPAPTTSKLPSVMRVTRSPAFFIQNRRVVFCQNLFVNLNFPCAPVCSPVASSELPSKIV